MIAECIRLAEGLVEVVEEETRRLQAGEGIGSLKALVTSKVRLTDQLEREIALLKKAEPAAVKAAGDEEHERLVKALDRLAVAAEENGKIVQRKQAITDDLLGAVLQDVRRNSGATIMRYGEKGSSLPGHRSAAVAVDARL